MFDNLKNLCLIDGVSGNEGAVSEFIINEISPYAECYIDPLGNVIAHKKGAQKAAKRVLFDAHMDEVGMIITDIRDDGLLTFSCVGGINTEVLLARRVREDKYSLQVIRNTIPILLIKNTPVTKISASILRSPRTTSRATTRPRIRSSPGAVTRIFCSPTGLTTSFISVHPMIFQISEE